MVNKDVAELVGYELIKGKIITTSEQIRATEDLLIKESDLEEIWYKDETEMFFENTKEGLQKLYEFEKKCAKDKKKK